MYACGNSVFCLMHGAGIIEDIEQLIVDGKKKDYYVILISGAKISIKIPVDNETSLLRPIIDKNEAKDVLDSIGQLQIEDTTNWSKRYRENMDRLKTGNVLENAKVLKSLILRNQVKTLSAGERKMLHSVKQILFTELALALNMDRDEIELAVYNAIG